MATLQSAIPRAPTHLTPRFALTRALEEGDVVGLVPEKRSLYIVPANKSTSKHAVLWGVISRSAHTMCVLGRRVCRAVSAHLPFCRSLCRRLTHTYVRSAPAPFLFPLSANADQATRETEENQSVNLDMICLYG